MQCYLNSKCKIAKILIMIIFLIIFTLNIVSEQNVLGKEIEVPLELVKFIAKTKIEEVWGQCSILLVIPTLNENNKLNTYYVILKLNGKSILNKDELMRMVRERKETLNILTQNHTKPISNETLRDIKRKLWGVDEFCTVVVSSTFDGFPIPRYFKGLPVFLINFDESKVFFERVYKKPLKEPLEPLFYNLGHGGEYFGHPDEENLIINAYTFRLEEKSKLTELTRDENQLKELIEMKNKISEEINREWLYWMRRYKEENQ